MTFKAIIVITQPGAMDAHDKLFPTDTQSWNALNALRGAGPDSLYDQYTAVGTPRTLAALAATALSPLNAGPDALDPGRTFAMSPQMTRCAGLFNAGKGTIVSDVGPLVRPITKANFLGIGEPRAAAGVDYPLQLYAHNSQQEEIQTGGIGGAFTTGYGGRLVDLIAQKLGLDPAHKDLDRIAFSTTSFLDADAGGEFRITTGGAAQVLDSFSAQSRMTGTDGGGPMLAPLNALYRGERAYTGRGLLEQTLDGKLKTYTGVGDKFNAYMAAAVTGVNAGYVAPALTTAGNYYNVVGPTIMNILARNESSIAVTGGLNHMLIHVRGGLPNNDSHRNQAATAGLAQGYLDALIGYLMDQLEAIGLADQVLIADYTEFGRTLVPNATGTDHAWGNYMFIYGGAGALSLGGGKIVGGTPIAFTSDVDGTPFNPQNADSLDYPYLFNSRGYVLPRNSVDQAFANFGYFLGLTAAEMANGIGALPPAFERLPNFIPGGGTIADAVLPIVAAPV